MELRSLFVRIKGDTSDLEQKLGRTNSLVDKFKQGVAMGAGFGLFHQASNAIGNVTSAAIKLSADYEQSMNLLQATSGASAAEMEALRETAKSLGSDMSLPGTSAADATVAMLELNKAGLSLNDTMTAARGVLQLSAAAQVDNATAAQITANALNTFGLAGTDATRVADLLAAGANSSSASMTDLSQVVQQAGFAFKATNQGIEDLITAGAALTNVGLSGSDSGTALKNAMLQLAAPTQEASAVMQQYGINVRDAQGNMLPLPALIGHLKTQLEGLSPAQRDAALKTLLQSDGMKAMIPLLELGTDGFEDLKTKVLEQGAAAKMAEAQNKGFHGAMDGLKSAAESLAIEGLTPILPLLTGLIKGAATVVGWIGQELPIALTAAAVALGAYALATTSAAVGTGNLGLALVLAGSQAVNAAAAFAAIAIPIAAIAVAVAGPIIALNHLTDEATKQAEQIRQNSDEWQRGKVALDQYREAQKLATGETRSLGEAQAQELERLIALRDDKLKRSTGDGGWNWLMAGLDSDDVTQRQMAEIQDLDRQIAELTTTTNQNAQAIRSSSGDYDQAVQSYWNLEAAADGYAGTTREATKATEEWAKELEKITQQGTSAFLGVTGGFADYFDGAARSLEEHNQRIAELDAEKLDADTEAQRTAIDKRIAAENQSYNDQAVAQALAYANQRQAQRQHLGEMLLDWINNERLKLAATNELTPEMEARFAQLTTFTKEQYGLMGTGVEEGFGQILMGFQGVIDGTVTNLDALKTATQQTEDHFSKVELRARELERQYVAEVLIKSEGKDPVELGRELEEAKKQAYIQAELDVTEVENKEARLQEVVNRIPNHLQSQLFLDAQNWDPVADAALNQKETLATPITTDMSADGAAAVGEAERIQAVYDRMDRKIETMFDADPSQAIQASADATQAIDAVQDEHTTILNVDGSPAVAGAMQTGYDINAGLASGIASSAYMVSNAMQKTAASAYAAAKGYLQIASPSKRFHEIGRFIDEGLALGVAEHSDDPIRAVESMGEKLVSAHDRYLDDLDTATQRFAEEQTEIWDRYYADLAEQTDAFNSNKFDDQLDFYDHIAGLDSAAREAAMQRQRDAWDISQQMAAENRAAEGEAFYNAALEEIEADTQRAEKLTAIAEDVAEKKRQIAEEGDAARKATLEAELHELESREQYLKEVDEQRDQRAAERLDRLRNAESELAEDRDESLSEAQKSYDTSVKDIESRFLESFDSMRDGIGGVADSTESAAQAIVNAYTRITAAASAAASSATSNAATASTVSDEVPQGSYALGTGDRGLPDDGLFYGHANEIIANPDQSDALRGVGGIEQAIAKARSYDNLGGQFPQRATTTSTTPVAASSQTFILEKLADTIIIKDELDIEMVAAMAVQKIKRRMGG